jgi:hypothetical protein
MNYLAAMKQIGLDKLVGFLVRVAGAVMEVVVKLYGERKRRRAEPQEVASPESVQVELTVVSIRTETIAVREIGRGDGEAP